MRSPLLPTLLLAATVAAQHGGMSGMSMPVATPTPAVLSADKKIATPTGCKKLNTDTDWPSKEVFDTELPGWQVPMADGDHKHPDVALEAKTKDAVIKAVKFAAKHNVRLAIVNSGHDFLAR
jgi:hypothetical protein